MTKKHVKNAKKFLDSLEFRPLGFKIELLKKVLRNLKIRKEGKELPLPREAKDIDFLNGLSEQESKEVFKIISEGLEKEKKKLKNIKRVFSRWNSKIDEDKLEKIACPDNYEIDKVSEEGNSFYCTITSPSVKKWVREKTTGKPENDVFAMSVLKKAANRKAAVYVYGEYEKDKNGKYLYVDEFPPVIYELKEGGKKKAGINLIELLNVYLLLEFLEKKKIERLVIKMPPWQWPEGRKEFIKKRGEEEIFMSESMKEMYENIGEAATKKSDLFSKFIKS